MNQNIFTIKEICVSLQKWYTVLYHLKFSLCVSTLGIWHVTEVRFSILNSTVSSSRWHFTQYYTCILKPLHRDFTKMQYIIKLTLLLYWHFPYSTINVLKFRQVFQGTASKFGVVCQQHPVSWRRTLYCRGELKYDRLTTKSIVFSAGSQTVAARADETRVNLVWYF